VQLRAARRRDARPYLPKKAGSSRALNRRILLLYRTKLVLYLFIVKRVPSQTRTYAECSPARATLKCDDRDLRDALDADKLWFAVM
jgi:hypothetical protein